jgi:two-component system sensor histidine kinase AlgZ
MHPILTNRRLVPYLAAWLPLAGVLAALLRLEGSVGWLLAILVALPASLLYAFICLAAWYPVRALPLGRTPLSTVLSAHAVGALISTVLWLAAIRVWLEVLGGIFASLSPGGAFGRLFPVLGGFGLLLYLLAVTFDHLLVAFEESRRAERRALELEILTREAELKWLRAQIDPHFLFNSLNTIAALTHAEPDTARTMCLRLADFLRQGLRAGNRERIRCSEELDLARSFLGVEQVRFGPRLRIEEAVEKACDDVPVPPLILQPLVENAVRHGIASLVEGGLVRLEVRREGERIRISVENPVDPEERSPKGDGVGLRNVRERLDRAYGAEAGLRVVSEQTRFRAELLIPAEPAAAESAPAEHATADPATADPATGDRGIARDGSESPAGR